MPQPAVLLGTRTVSPAARFSWPEISLQSPIYNLQIQLHKFLLVIRPQAFPSPLPPPHFPRSKDARNSLHVTHLIHSNIRPCGHDQSLSQTVRHFGETAPVNVRIPLTYAFKFPTRSGPC